MRGFEKLVKRLSSSDSVCGDLLSLKRILELVLENCLGICFSDHNKFQEIHRIVAGNWKFKRLTVQYFQQMKTFQFFKPTLIPGLNRRRHSQIEFLPQVRFKRISTECKEDNN